MKPVKLMQNEYIQALVKHLPPSGASLRLLDIDDMTGVLLAKQRADLLIQPVARDVRWNLDADSVDAITAYGASPDADFLAQALNVLRPGGRLIMVDPMGEPDASLVELLEDAGFTRILVEPAYENSGVLIRGEKPHTEQHTVDRIKQVAAQDQVHQGDDTDPLANYRGRYVHLLVRQMPNKPVWALKPDERIAWEAVALERDHEPVLLAFSSLPKAVAFMQPAVVAGWIKDVNKVPKFSKETAQCWPQRVCLNVTVDALRDETFVTVSVDPTTAEAPDE
ncbi:MAG: hypothetical protein K8L99_32020 [Anaerolineae bacterium]|nr:hypothetical protein [Anaerolineae bacterium]